jgi:hypothetical protein
MGGQGMRGVQAHDVAHCVLSFSDTELLCEL